MVLMNEVVVLAGGKGTRSADPSLPKSLQKVRNKTILEWQLENIADWIRSDIHIIGGFGGEKIEELIKRIRPKYQNLNLIYHFDEAQLGTLPALYRVLPVLKSKNVAVLLGDLMINFQWRKFMYALNNFNVDGLVVTHPNEHPEDSDLILESSRDQSIVFLPKDRTRSTEDGNLAIAGIFGFKTSILRERKVEGFDISTDLLRTLVGSSSILNYLTIDYIKDSGTPARLQAINRDLSTGFFSNRDPKNRAVIFVDFDNTLHANIENKGRDTEISIHPNILKSIKEINQSGVPIVILTNQPGIAKGFCSFEDVDTFFRRFQFELNRTGAFIDAWFYCPHHPERGWLRETRILKVKCSCRKPKIGLLKKFNEYNNFNSELSWMLGDSPSDLEFAKNGNLNFMMCIEDDSKSNFVSCFTSEALASTLNRVRTR
jgi:mannose-1-phosphate guanylyltransferase / phosphomannomutase